MTTPHTPEPANVQTFTGGGTFMSVGAVLAVAGLGGFAAGWASEPKQALFSYLTAYMFGLSIAIGGLIFLYVNYLMRTKWAVPVRRLTETVAGLAPLFLLLFIPIVLGRKELFIWMTPELIVDPLAAHAIHKKHAYLNETFFFVRAALYFAIWIGFSLVLRNMSKKNDENASYDQHPKAYRLASVGLALTAFAMTFASFDWIGGTMPEWFSTMYGVWYFAGGFMAFFATMILLVTLLSGDKEKPGYFDSILKPNGDHFHTLGRLMFAFIVFWAYISYAQGFIIYIANKPEEVSFYIARTKTDWVNWGWLLVFGHFLMPFVILLLRWVKFVKRPLAAAAFWMLLMHFADMQYQIMPVLHSERIVFHWLDIACLLGVVGSMMVAGTLLLRGRFIAPKNDVYFEKGRRYNSP
jgi:hypothetical protein